MVNSENIKKIFDNIAPYYDKMNNLISFGTHYLIKILSIKELKIQPNSVGLDLCCGTGDFSKIIRKIYPKSKIIGLDFSEKMLKTAKSKNPECVFIQGDCTNLPFENEFDYITIGFGLRNIEQRAVALTQIYKSLKCGGKFLHLDFGEENFFSKIFDFLVPYIAKILKTDIKSYEHLINSKRLYPKPDKLIKEFEKTGFKFLKKRYFLFKTICLIIMQKHTNKY